MLQPQTDKNRKKAAQLQGSYTAEHSRVKTPENTGICWTFGAMASLESVMMTAGTAFSLINLSERQLACFTFHAGYYTGNTYSGYYRFGSKTDSNCFSDTTCNGCAKADGFHGKTICSKEFSQYL